MTIAEFIRELQKLPPNYEIGVMTANAHARPPTVVRINPFAGWDNNGDCKHSGFHDVTAAYLIRPEREIIR